MVCGLSECHFIHNLYNEAAGEEDQHTVSVKHLDTSSMIKCFSRLLLYINTTFHKKLHILVISHPCPCHSFATVPFLLLHTLHVVLPVLHCVILAVVVDLHARAHVFLQLYAFSECFFVFHFCIRPKPNLLTICSIMAANCFGCQLL